MLTDEQASEAFRAHERLLWGLTYRMTGLPSEADDVVQDTFMRFIERPPEDLDAPVRPWLVRVALNLARDRLRRRRRQEYAGPWLPAPVPTERLALAEASPSARYEVLESATLAFLTALEALKPRERAVLLLRDVLDYSVREVAGCLDMSEANVKVITHRARRAMAAYDAARCRPADVEAAAMAAIQRFVTCVSSGDLAGLEALFAGDAVAIADGGGEFIAARVPVQGPERIARLYLGIARKGAPSGPSGLRIQSFNGVPSLVLEHPPLRPGWPPRSVFQLIPGSDGRVRLVLSVTATAKLASV